VKVAPLPHNELGRLATLRQYDILDTPDEPAFDDLTRLASTICGVPIALITFVDERRQWFKSRVGLALRETARDGFFCAHTILQRDIFVIPDAQMHPDFAANPLVNDGPCLRFYAGMPLITPSGHAVGTLCILDRKPRRLTSEQAESLRILSHQVLTQLELRHKVTELKRTVVEQQRSEEALRQTEEKYRSIFENVAEGIFQTTPDGHYIAVNPMLARIYGYDSPNELMEAISDIEHQIYVDPTRRSEFARLMQENEIVTNFESEVFRKDRTIIWISENARAVRNKAGLLLYYEGTVEDITERRQTEDALRNSEVLYHSLVENLPQNILRKDRQGRFTFANRRFCATLRRPLSEILGKTDFDFFPEATARKYHEDDQRVMETLQSLETVEAHPTPEGMLYVQVIKTPLYDHAGQVVGIQGIFWDVTERKKMEEDLAYERDLLTALLDNVPDSIYFKDKDSRFIKCSKALAGRFGLVDPTAAVGKSDTNFFSRAHAGPALADEQKIINSGQPIIGKTERETWPDGRETWALTTKMPLRNKDGVIIGTFGISKDITALKLAEEELQRARDAAVESARLKAEFLANVSHEIRTPMNAIIGMSGLLMDTEMSSEQQDYAQTIRDSADTLLAIINDILDFSKIEAGKLSLETIDFDLREVVEGTVEILAERATRKDIELASWIHPDVPVHLRGDPGRLRQVLVNLVGNAVKFTERGEVVVAVEKQDETANEVVIRFGVRDTGIGIAEKALPNLFQAFTQADGSMARKYGGTGLGLAIVKQIVELMHGYVAVASRQGEGSTFSVTVRLEKQPNPPPRLERTAGQENFDKLSVLVVEDNGSTREILQQQIASWGIRCGAAADAKTALESFRRSVEAGAPYDIGVIDLHMEEVDGLALAKEIKADPLLAKTRLIILANLGYRLDAEELRGAGIEACLLKPVRETRLFDALLHVNAQPQERGGLPSHKPSSNREGHHARAPVGFGMKPAIRILLAEDNVVNQRMALRQLQKLGYTADTAVNGIEVLASIEANAYDLILMDCQMPELDGYRATQEIRRRERECPTNPAGRPLYIVAMTANALGGDRDRCLEVGMDDYISKPVHLSELQNALERAARQFGTEGFPARKPNCPLPLDKGILAELRDLKGSQQADPLIELIDLFIRDGSSRLETMETALQSKSLADVAQGAHGLKGSASNLGAPRLATLCGEVEKYALAGASDQAAIAFTALREEFVQVRALLQEETRKSQLQP
jgi:PAS domain S-box-containing protein